MRINSSGIVTIGATSSPSGLFHVFAGQAAISARNTAGNSVVNIIGDSNTSIGYIGTSNANSTSALLEIQSANGINFLTSTAERMRIDSAGNVGIGNTPSGTSATGYRSLELGTTAGTGITAGNGDFYVPVNAYVAGGAWKYATSSTASLLNINTTTLTWSNAVSGTAGNNISLSERMRVNSFGIGLGGSTPSSGTGITFPATQSASSDANTLDDYEEGTWTVGVKGSTTAGTYTALTANASYTKIGRQVTCNFYVRWESGTGTGNLLITGLPFTSRNASGFYYAGSISSANINYTAGNTLSLFLAHNTTEIEVYQIPPNSATIAVPYDAGDALIIGSITYFV